MFCTIAALIGFIIGFATQSDMLNARSKIKLMQLGNKRCLSGVPCILDHFKISVLLPCNVNIR